MATQALPPWGQMDERYLKDIKNNPKPVTWVSPNGSDWPTWLQGVVNVVSAQLWPVYVDSSTWDTAHVRDLFDADFALMPALHAQLRAPISVGFPTGVTHLEFFTQEDSAAPFGTGYERYDPSLSSTLRTALLFAFGNGLNDRGSTTHLQVKQAFQRPRPWQVYVIQGRSPAFQYRRADTASTPSLISGHCFQGCIGGCAAFADPTFGQLLSAASIELLKQFTVDIGDRRVFAGVHFPSDNLSSWYTALRLIPTVFDAAVVPAVRKFLWDAITTKSLVFAAIRDHVQAHPRNSPYAAIVGEMQKIALV